MEGSHTMHILYNGMEIARSNRSMVGISHTENMVLSTRQKHIQGDHTAVGSMAHQNIHLHTSFGGKSIHMQPTAWVTITSGRLPEHQRQMEMHNTPTNRARDKIMGSSDHIQGVYQPTTIMGGQTTQYNAQNNNDNGVQNSNKS
eukprot:3459186-Ditylum_brightwellii.AAC.1